MAPRELSPEIVALVHHVELNKAGWWQKSLQKLIANVLWMSGDLPTAEVRDSLQSIFGVDIDSNVLRNNLVALRDAGKVLMDSGERWDLADDCAEDIEKQVDHAEAIISNAETRFREILNEHCPDLDSTEVWSIFSNTFLVPLIKRMGARTYELVSGKIPALERALDFRDFLKRFPEQQRATIKEVALSFLDPNDSVCRSYVLGQLNGWFVLRAASLDENTLRRLETSQSTRPSFAVLVDTNFLFSILGLHDNPSNEAAKRLMWLGDQLRNRVTLKFYAASVTVEEARGVVDNVAEDARGMVLGPNLAAAAEEAGELGGMLLKYLQECQKAGRALDADEYFGPYQRNLVTILRGNQVELFNQRTDEYATRRDVLDDLNGQLAFQESQPARRRKTYSALLHDMILWHLVMDKRPAVAESMLDARYWIVTVDFRFLSFDSFKRRSRNLPICAHPNSLIQALQLWVPSSEEFETALMDSFRLPLLMGTFDAAAERITTDILKALSRFEDVEDLSEETIAAVLVNEALRQKLTAEKSVERQVELVRDAVIEEFGRLKDKLGHTEAELARTQGEAAEKLGQAEDELHRLRGEVAERAAAESALKERVGALESNLQIKEEQQRLAAERRNFLLFTMLLPLLALGAVATAIAFAVQLKADLEWWEAMLGAWSLALIVWTSVVRLAGSQKEQIASWSLFKLYAATHTYLIGVFLIGIIACIFGNAAYDRVASHWP